MLPALANGLREGAKFDVLTLPFGDPSAAAAAQRADALVVFYGSAAQSLQSVVQDFAPTVRSRGGRVVAVLQRDQAAQRDDCFRAGASDLLFMPLPKEQFVSRLAASVALSYLVEAGVSATVQVGARGTLVPLAQATVTHGGIHAPAALPFQPGETVRVSWASFECWGLVARASPDAQVRFAGLAPDEEARIREATHKTGGASASSSRAEGGAANVPSVPKSVPAKPAPAQQGPAAPPSAVPGRSQGKATTPPPQPATRAPATAGAPEASSPSPDGPTWPTVFDVDACRNAGLSMVREKKAPSGATPELAAAAKRVVGVMNVGERNALEKAGPDSHFAAALGARIVLELARAEATRLLTTQPSAVVDDAAMMAVTHVVEAAAAQLQKAVDVAIGRADVDTLQLLTVANAALSRDQLVFREAADRLRGIGSAPRPGSGALDPEIALPGQISRPGHRTADRAAMKPELREFAGLGERPRRSRRKALLLLCVVAGGAAVANLMLFAYPRVSEVHAPIAGVSRIEISGKVARVTLSPEFAGQEARAIAALTQTLRERGVERALLVQRNGSVAGQLAVREGKVFGRSSPLNGGDGQPQTPATTVAPGSPGLSELPTQAASAQPR
jgi:hypothetical protein